MTRARQIVAFGGGGFSMEAGNPLLDDYVLGLAAGGGERPKVCFLPTASGDADHYIVRFYRHFAARRCEPSHVSLFRRDCGTDDVRGHLLAQDLVYVGGGSVTCLMGVLRAHQLDVALREAWAMVPAQRATSVLFEFDDHLTLFEVYASEANAKAVIEKARSLVPGKPLAEAIVSHHHFDHTGGLRAAVSEGLTIVMQRGNEGLVGR